MPRAQERIHDYFTVGVPYIRIVDPRSHKGYNCTPQGMAETAVFRTESPRLSFRWRTCSKVNRARSPSVILLVEYAHE
jgi:hypothetical protein